MSEKDGQKRSASSTSGGGGGGKKQAIGAGAVSNNASNDPIPIPPPVPAEEQKQDLQVVPAGPQEHVQEPVLKLTKPVQLLLATSFFIIVSINGSGPKTKTKDKAQSPGSPSRGLTVSQASWTLFCLFVQIEGDRRHCWFGALKIFQSNMPGYDFAKENEGGPLPQQSFHGKPVANNRVIAALQAQVSNPATNNQFFLTFTSPSKWEVKPITTEYNNVLEPRVHYYYKPFTNRHSTHHYHHIFSHTLR